VAALFTSADTVCSILPRLFRFFLLPACAASFQILTDPELHNFVDECIAYRLIRGNLTEPFTPLKADSSFLNLSMPVGAG
jgi:hypothetical protein